jgi:hypothetical protein
MIATQRPAVNRRGIGSRFRRSIVVVPFAVVRGLIAD